MMQGPVIKEVILKASSSDVWAAITRPEQMRSWYFDLPAFRPEIGFQFEFWGETQDAKYLHKCEVTESIPNAKLGYSWRYEGIAG